MKEKNPFESVIALLIGAVVLFGLFQLGVGW